jgi:hypothetical protein
MTDSDLPSNEEIVDFIKHCNAPGPATTDANEYKEVIEWLFFGKKRPNPHFINYFEMWCANCDWSSEKYGRGPPNMCPECHCSDVRADQYKYNPEFLPEGDKHGNN